MIEENDVLEMVLAFVRGMYEGNPPPGVVGVVTPEEWARIAPCSTDEETQAYCLGKETPPEKVREVLINLVTVSAEVARSIDRIWERQGEAEAVQRTGLR